VLRPGARIGADVTIEADQLILGHNARIGDGCVVRDLGGAARHVEVGDDFFLGPSSTVLLPAFVAGDYVAIHNHLLCNGYRPCVVGHNTWIGQNWYSRNCRPNNRQQCGIGPIRVSIRTHSMESC